MKKSISLCVALFMCVFILLSASTSQAADFRNRAFSVYGNMNPTSGELTGVYGVNADHMDIQLLMMNHGASVLTNIRFKFYDGNGNNVTVGGGYYQYPNTIAAHGAIVVNVNQLIANYSTTKFCSMEISWDYTEDVKPEISLQAMVKDINNNFLQNIFIPITNPNY
jgi:hypothetical protein